MKTALILYLDIFLKDSKLYVMKNETVQDIIDIPYADIPARLAEQIFKTNVEKIFITSNISDTFIEGYLKQLKKDLKEKTNKEYEITII
jgi:predicted transcriptional regulator